MELCFVHSKLSEQKENIKESALYNLATGKMEEFLPVLSLALYSIVYVAFIICSGIKKVKTPALSKGKDMAAVFSVISVRLGSWWLVKLVYGIVE